MGRLMPDRLASCGITGGDVLVETGMDSGWGIRQCSPIFKTLHTIEIDPALHYRMLTHMKRRFPKITMHLGNSPEVLRKIIDPARETVLFLDAHYVAEPGRVCHGQECPLMDELAAIFSFQWLVPPVIIVDDARMFQEWFWGKPWSRDYRKSHWPRQAQVEDLAGRFGFTVSGVRGMLLLKAHG